MEANTRGYFYQSPLCLLIIVACSITASEFLIMASFRLVPYISHVTREAIDSALLFAVTFPVVYFFVYRPLKYQIVEREKAKRDWQATVDSIKDPVYVHDEQFRIVRANKAYKELAGVPYKDIIDKPYYEVFPKMDGPLKACTNALELQEERRGEERRGEEEVQPPAINKIFRVRVYPARLQTENYSLHILEDITERRHAEQTTNRLASILDATTDLVGIAEPSGRILYANKGAYTMVRLPGNADLMSMNIRDFYPASEYDAVLKDAISTAIREGVWQGETVMLSRDGREIPVSQVIIAHKSVSGEVECLSTIVRDMSERKRIENELRALNESLEQRVLERSAAIVKANETLKKFETLFSEIEDLAYICDRNGNILFVNKIFKKLTGHRPEEFIGKPFAPLFDEKDLDVAMDSYRKTLRGKSPQYEITYKDTGILCEYKNIPVRDEKGNIAGVMGIARDITKRNQMEEKLRALNESLEQRVEKRTSELLKLNEELLIKIAELRQSEAMLRERDGYLCKLNSFLLAIRNTNEALLKVKNEEELFKIICGYLAELKFVKFTWIGMIEKDSFEVKPAAFAGHEEGYLSALQMKYDDTDYGKGAIGAAIKTGQIDIVTDVENNPRYKPWQAEAVKRGYKSVIAVPIKHYEDVIGAIMVYTENRDGFLDDEIKVLSEIATDIAVGVRSIRMEKELDKTVEELQTSFNSTVTAISLMGEFRDPYTAGHERRVARIACAIAAEMRLDKEQIEAIKVSAYLHDIGKIAVPVEILNKPTELNEFEYGIIKTHPKVGYDILKDLKFPWPVALVTLQHHETLNGTGYPSGLKGGEILLEAKILAVADVVEAMSSHRPYRPSIGLDAALEEIAGAKGILYDASAVDACLRLFKEKRFQLNE